MNQHPIEQAIMAAEQEQKKEGPQYWGYRRYAEVAIAALLDDQIVDQAAFSLMANDDTLSDGAARSIACTVLGSVGGGIVRPIDRRPVRQLAGEGAARRRRQHVPDGGDA